MAHSYSKILIHYVFSTKNREKIMTASLQKRLWSCMGGIARKNNMKALAIGEMEDHHLKKSFKEEYVSLLRKYVIDYDDRYILG